MTSTTVARSTARARGASPAAPGLDTAHAEDRKLLLDLLALAPGASGRFPVGFTPDQQFKFTTTTLARILENRHLCSTPSSAALTSVDCSQCHFPVKPSRLPPRWGVLRYCLGRQRLQAVRISTSQMTLSGRCGLSCKGFGQNKWQVRSPNCRE